MVITKDDEQRILNEAAAIREGRDPHTAASSSPTDAPATEGDAFPAAAPSPSPADYQVAEMVQLLFDVAYVKIGGPHWQMTGAVRQQSVEALAQCLVTYLPMIGQMGPLGALLTIHGIHLSSCVASSWMNARSPESSENEAQVRPHS